jgi:ubiquitin-protein ligase
MFIRQGWYRGSIFEFEIKFPKNYPQEPPEVKFNTPYPVHPRVCKKTGVVNLLVRIYIKYKDLTSVLIVLDE